MPGSSSAAVLAMKTIALVTLALTLLASAPLHVTLAAAGRARRAAAARPPDALDLSLRLPAAGRTEPAADRPAGTRLSQRDDRARVPDRRPGDRHADRSRGRPGRPRGPGDALSRIRRPVPHADRVSDPAGRCGDVRVDRRRRSGGWSPGTCGDDRRPRPAVRLPGRATGPGRGVVRASRPARAVGLSARTGPARRRCSCACAVSCERRRAAIVGRRPRPGRRRSSGSSSRPTSAWSFRTRDDQLFSSTVGDDVAFGPLNLGLAGRTRCGPASPKHSRKVGMTGQDDRVPFHLSGGEKRRAAIAGVLAMRPEVLAARRAVDVPRPARAAGVDPPHQRAAGNEADRLARPGPGPRHLFAGGR